MKTSTTYTTEKKSFIFAADSEQRGLNATLKAIYATKGMPEAGRTLAADTLAWDVFRTAANYVEYLRKNLPQVFNERGAICSVKVVEDSEENRKAFDNCKTEPVEVNGLACIRVWIPKTKYTCTEVYNLAKKAAKGLKAAEKAAEKAAKAAANEQKAAERRAAKIARLENQLAELKK